MKNHFYVYAWFDDKGIFYIGKGSNSRSTDYHYLACKASAGFWYKKPAKCEVIRSYAGRHFRVEVIKGGLAEDEALDLEKKLIYIIEPRGNMLVLGGKSRTSKKKKKRKQVNKVTEPRLTGAGFFSPNYKY